MKKSLLTLLGVGLLLTSCQSDEPFAPGEGGEKQVTFTLTAPDAVGTRANRVAGSDEGGIANNPGETIYYSLELYYQGVKQGETMKTTATGKQVTFSPTVILGRNYEVVAYANLKSEQNDLKNITVATGINDEKNDAYFATVPVQFTENDLSEEITLKRPFGKLRLVATDYDASKTAITNIEVTYAAAHQNLFDAQATAGTNVYGVFSSNNTTVTYTATHNPDYYADATGNTIFVDYIAAPAENETLVKFNIKVDYATGGESFTRTFTQDIPVRRNALTTLSGNFFTANSKITVKVDENFDVKMEDVADGVYNDVNGNYYISNANGLKWVSEQVNTMAFYVNQSANIFDGKTVYIVNDIDLGGAEWRPIGDYAFSRTSFNGTFDGQGHTISNFKVTEPVRWTEKVTEASYGFFGNVKGTVKNLTVKNATVNPEGGRYSAALVGRLHNGGCVENCHVVTSSVTINHWQVGGLVGQNNNGNISGCSVTGSTITGKAAVGAIIGMDMTAGEHTIENCRVANTALEQNASFGASYDESYGIAVGLVNASGIILNLNNVVAENNTIKGVASNKLIGEKVDGAQVNISQPVSTAAKLAEVINSATTDVTVVFVNDLEGNITLNQKRGLRFTIDGNGKNYKGGIHIFGNGGANDRWMTIKNINFDGIGLTDDEGCIYTTGAQNGVNSYACNVTIEDCTFTGAGVAAIRQNVAGEKNWTIKNCTVASNMHSFLQVSNTNGELIVENCKVYSKNGANLNSTCNASFKDCEFDVKGYAVRVGVNSGGNPDATKVFNFTDCSLKSANDDGDAVVIIRNDAQKATLNFVRTTLYGNPKISGVTSNTTINGTY